MKTRWIAWVVLATCWVAGCKRAQPEVPPAQSPPAVPAKPDGSKAVQVFPPPSTEEEVLPDPPVGEEEPMPGGQPEEKAPAAEPKVNR